MSSLAPADLTSDGAAAGDGDLRQTAADPDQDYTKGEIWDEPGHHIKGVIHNQIGVLPVL